MAVEDASRGRNRELRQAIGQKLREVRKAKGLTLQRAAEGLGVSRPAVALWELGRAFPSVENLIKLASLYRVSIDWLLGLEQPVRLSGSGMEKLFSGVVWSELPLEDDEFVDQMMEALAARVRSRYPGD